MSLITNSAKKRLWKDAYFVVLFRQYINALADDIFNFFRLRSIECVGANRCVFVFILMHWALPSSINALNFSNAFQRFPTLFNDLRRCWTLVWHALQIYFLSYFSGSLDPSCSDGWTHGLVLYLNILSSKMRMISSHKEAW